MNGWFSMHNVDLSVIVPVYNVEKYLRKCLDSLINQTLQSIEIIVVNDGSTDGSASIVDEYADRYPTKIRAFHIPNAGLGAARNFGIDQAKGHFIGFVDSDDWVDNKMYQSMFEMTKRGFDIVICDFLIVQDGWESGHIAQGFRGNNFLMEEIIMHSLDPASASNKIYARKFFDLIPFSEGWYEDIGTTPIYLSYARQIGYIEFPFYYYRQRRNSITNSLDNRTKDVMKAWERVLGLVNPRYKTEIEYAIYKSIVAFIGFKPEFADDFINYAKLKRNIFINNTYFKSEVKNEKVIDILDMELIPKKIHFFWFGGNPKSDLIMNCMMSWKKYAPDYEIIEWNESNCNMSENEYVREAYDAKKWAFVSDYFRIKVLYEHGGFYLDTDTELTNRIDFLRKHNAAFGFETNTLVNVGIIGAQKKHSLIKEWLGSYSNEQFKKANGEHNTEYTVVKRLTTLLSKKYGIELNGKTQFLKGNIGIYSANVLTINVYDGENVAIHHYDASWWDVKSKVSYKNTVLQEYFGKINYNKPNNSSVDDVTAYYQRLIQTYESTISWRVTKPLRLANSLLRKIKRG
jgi:glycosyltransferase involved in cell wall biosynthesis